MTEPTQHRRAHLRLQAEARDRARALDPVAQAESARLRTRRRLLLWSAPLLLAALVVVVKALSVPILTTSGTSQLESEDYVASEETFARLQTLNVAETWKPYFNRGTALLAGATPAGAGLDEAVTELREAHDRAPALPDDIATLTPEALAELPRCMVQRNLSIAHELQGDVAQTRADGLVTTMRSEQEQLAALGPDGPADGSTPPDPEATRQQAIDAYLEAEELYRTANSTRVEGGCAEDVVAQERDVEKETTAREKREELEKEPEQDPAGGETPPPPPDPQEQKEQEEEQQRRDELQQREAEAQKDKDLTEGSVGPGQDVGPYDPTTPQW